MIYREPQARSRTELEAAFADPSEEVVATAIVDAASHHDSTWLVDILLSLAHDERRWVRNGVLLGFGILARRGRLQADRRVWQTALEARGDPLISGTAEDLLDDLELWGTPGRDLEGG